MHSDSMTLACVIRTLLSPSNYYNSFKRSHNQ